jgi:hypothetical protein
MAAQTQTAAMLQLRCSPSRHRCRLFSCPHPVPPYNPDRASYSRIRILILTKRGKQIASINPDGNLDASLVE